MSVLTIRSLLPDLKQSIDNGTAEERVFAVDDVLELRFVVPPTSRADMLVPCNYALLSTIGSAMTCPS